MEAEVLPLFVCGAVIVLALELLLGGFILQEKRAARCIFSSGAYLPIGFTMSSVSPMRTDRWKSDCSAFSGQ